MLQLHALIKIIIFYHRKNKVNYSLLCAAFLLCSMPIQKMVAMENVQITSIKEVEQTAEKLKSALPKKDYQLINDNFSQFVDSVNKYNKDSSFVDKLYQDVQPITGATDDLGLHAGIEAMKVFFGIEAPLNKDFAIVKIIKKNNGADEKEVILSKDEINTIGYYQYDIAKQIEKLDHQKNKAELQSPESLLVKTFLGTATVKGTYCLASYLYPASCVLDKSVYYTTVVATGIVGAYTALQSCRLVTYTEYEKNQQTKIEKLNEEKVKWVKLQKSFSNNFEELNNLSLYIRTKAKNGFAKISSK